jgi:hypothetical protein
MRPDTREARWQRLEAFLRANHITWEFVVGFYSMYANAYRRHVGIRDPKTDEDEASCWHEIGHVLSGTCPQRLPHENVIVDDGTTNLCLECERSAWATAMKLRPFTSTMFRHMQRCLSSYRQSSRTPQPFVAARNADRLMNYLESFAIPLQRKVEWEHRTGLVKMWQQELEDAGVSMSLTRARALLAKATR